MNETNAYITHNKNSDLAYKLSKTNDIMVFRPDDPVLKTSINFSITVYRKSEIVQHI